MDHEEGVGSLDTGHGEAPFDQIQRQVSCHHRLINGWSRKHNLSIPATALSDVLEIFFGYFNDSPLVIHWDKGQRQGER